MKFKVRCPECKMMSEIPLINHHIIDRYMKKYLISVGGYEEKEVERLRRQLRVGLCKDCERQKHENNPFEQAWKGFVIRVKE